MIDLYHHGSSVCAAKVRFALGEKGLAWEGHYLDIHQGRSVRARVSETQSQRWCRHWYMMVA